MQNFVAIGTGLPPESNIFTILVAVNNQYGRVVTAYSTDPIVDGNKLDNCNWAGIQVCEDGGGGVNFGDTRGSDLRRIECSADKL